MKDNDYIELIEKETLEKSVGEKYDQYFYGHGKLLLSGEYFILDGACGLALPTVVGQSMGVKYEKSFEPLLTWKSYDSKGELWFECQFEFWHFKPLGENPPKEALEIQKLLTQARKQNKHFLREEGNVLVETRLGFPIEWGLGSSSTLIYNIAQWAYISPFELLFNTQGGSGYDIACAQSEGPILYEKKAGPNWSIVEFSPSFKGNLYFVYLGRKQDSREAIQYYKQNLPYPKETIASISDITREMLNCSDLGKFESLVHKHEQIVSQCLNMIPVKKRLFNDYWGSIKSLGAWGGDFVLVTSDRSEKETKQYFEDLGHTTILNFDEIILKRPRLLPNQEESSLVH